jgi:hypothetical protein
VTGTGRRRWLGAAAAAAVLLLAACGGDGDAKPTRLLDGSALPAVPSAVGAVDGAVMTIVHDLPATDERAVTCVTGFGVGNPGAVVERIGVDGRSVTFARGSRLFACDAAEGAREGSAASCGGAFGRRERGRLTDPRLDLANCTDADGESVAFVWIEPAPEAAYVAVDRDGWVEVYARRAGLPVRVATSEGIGGDTSSLGLTVTQYAGDGSELRKDDVDAHVAG